MRFSPSTYLLMCLSLDTLKSIIRTDYPILVEMTDLVNSFLIFLAHMILLRWSTFLLRSLTVTLSPAILDLFISSDTSTCCTMAFPLSGKF